MTALLASSRFGNWALLMSLAFWVGAAQAATITITSNTNWSAITTGSGSGGQPNNTDDIVVTNNSTLTVNVTNGACRSLQLGAASPIVGTGTLVFSAATSQVTVSGSGTGAGIVTIGGTANAQEGSIDMTNGGTLTSRGWATSGRVGTWTPGAGTVVFTATNTLAPDGELDTFNNLTINGSGITATLDRNISISGNLTVTAGTLDLVNHIADRSPAGGGTISVANGATLKIFGGGGDFPEGYTTVALGPTSTVEYYGNVNQTVSALSGQSYGHLVLSGDTTIKTIGTASDKTLNIAGDLTVAAGTTYRGTTRNPVVTLKGNFTNNGTFQSGTGNFTFNGSVPQTITGTAATGTTFTSLTLDNAAGLTLTGTHNVSALGVTLTNGTITTNANILYISTGLGISGAGATRFVIGNLRKRVVTGTNVARQFEVGTVVGGVARYSPVTSGQFGNVTIAGDFTVSTTTGDHPNIGTSTLDPAKSVNRYWTFTNNSVVFDASANNQFIFNFVAGDIDGGANTGNFLVSRFSPALPGAGTWAAITPSARTGTTTTISGAGITSANVSGDYAIAEQSGGSATPGSFNAFETSTAAGAVTGPIRTKVSGVAFSLDVVAIQSGAQLAGFTGTAVTVELLGNNTTGVALDGSNCPVSFTLVQTVSPNPTITGGRSTVSFAAVTQSWRNVRVRVRYPTASPTVTSCSTDNFAIRPASFSAAITDLNWSAAGTARTLANTGATGGNVHKAGQPFTITVTPAPGTATNYDGSPIVSALSCTLPGTCANGTLTPGAFSGAGTRVSSMGTYSEAGAFNLTLVDQDYASVDSGDGTPADCSATGWYVCQAAAPLAVGRFVPDRFVLASPSTPVLRTFNTTACSPRSFTYIGQPFWYLTNPSATLNAVNAAGTVTANYPVTSSKPAIAESYADATAPASAPLNSSAIGSAVLVAGNGTGTYSGSVSASAQLSYDRHPSTLSSPFTAAIKLTVTASDSSENAVTGNGVIATASPLLFDGGGAGIAFDSGAQFRYGRLQIGTARGSHLSPLAVPMETQYSANGTTFTTNTADNCTTLAVAGIGLGNYAGNLNSGETTPSLSGAFASGKKSLSLSAPGAGNNGSVDLVVNLGTTMDSCTTFNPVPSTTGANQPWLRGRWCGTTESKDTTGRATFGIPLGSEETIHLRENF